VVDDGDLVAADARKPLLLRRAIALAESPAELATAAAGLNPVIIALHDARVTAEQVTAVRSVVLDALTRRLVELAVRDAGPPPVPFTWFALGSLARREAAPSSDVDSALAWDGTGRRCGRLLRPGNPGGGRGPAGLRNLPGRTRGQRGQPDLRAVPCLLAAGRAEPVRGPDPGQGADPGVGARRQPPGMEFGGAATGGGLWEGQPTPELLRLLARFALSFRPPTGFLRDFVVEHSGERRGQLDLKHGGLIPIVDLARWAGMAAGMASASTRERLRAAEAAGTMDSAEAQTLTEAFGFIFSLRLDHQVEQLRRGSVPDDFIDPKTLNPLARSYLREAFRAVASVQATSRPSCPSGCAGADLGLLI
jgi:Predicted signal-transduction protein containing cAMP-binding and CBS domains